MKRFKADGPASGAGGSVLTESGMQPKCRTAEADGTINCLPMIVFINGAFGVGKTSVARALRTRLPRSIVYDPELIGIALQRITRVADFQDLRLWRRLTILAIRALHRLRPNVIVPMAFSNPDYLHEILSALPDARHFCLVAPVEVVHARIRTRRLAPRDLAWQLRRASECCAVHGDAAFATQVDASVRTVEEIAAYLSSEYSNP